MCKIINILGKLIIKFTTYAKLTFAPSFYTKAGLNEKNNIQNIFILITNFILTKIFYSKQNLISFT